MAPPKLTQAELERTARVYHACGHNQVQAALKLGISRGALQSRVPQMKAAGLLPDIGVPAGAASDVEMLKDRVRELEAEVRGARREQLDAEYVRRKIIGLGEDLDQSSPPEWLARPTTAFAGPGVPTLFASDWHWGEIVDPDQVGGVNAYNLAIAHERARTMIEVTIDLLRNHIQHTGGDYPGIVLALGGDMVSGDIHEELTATNEVEIMPIVVDLWGALVWCIERLADEFGSVFVPCVSGNHGRNTAKIRAKGRNFTSFDWLLYSFLEKRFEADPRVRLMVPAGSDAHYSVFGHRYLLTHGDQFRGGDGMIGALGPIIRGDHRKRGRNAQIDLGYDTMILGHWHQLIQLQRIIVNGSLKGYDEYSYQSNFPFEPPRQALWLTHPDRGITFSAPVHVERKARVRTGKQAASWVAWKEAA